MNAPRRLARACSQSNMKAGTHASGVLLSASSLYLFPAARRRRALDRIFALLVRQHASRVLLIASRSTCSRQHAGGVRTDISPGMVTQTVSLRSARAQADSLRYKNQLILF